MAGLRLVHCRPGHWSEALRPPRGVVDGSPVTTPHGSLLLLLVCLPSPTCQATTWPPWQYEQSQDAGTILVDSLREEIGRLKREDESREHTEFLHHCPY